jgi:hypothetical protein
MQRMRTAPKDVVAKPRYMRARFSGNCKCGSRMSAGDMICYDTVSRQSMCVPCGKKQTKQFLSRIDVCPSNEAQELLDQIGRLEALPDQGNDRIVEELRDVRARLQQHAKNDGAVRRMFIKSRIRSPLICIFAQYPGACASCRSEQKVGDAVAYDPDQRKILCYLCLPE